MPSILIKWLNEEIRLSKQITDIPEDFKNGYLFAELLYKVKQIQNLSQYKDSKNKKDIIRNFCFLNKALLDIGIFLNEKDKIEIINGGLYASKIYLLKIRQVLNKKNINLEQLKFKYSNELHKLYNKMRFKSQNEKYLYELKERLENEKNYLALKSKTINFDDDINKKTEENKKFEIGGTLYNQLKKKYSHLELSDFDLEIILTDMKEEEKKLNILKQRIQNVEKKRKNQCLSKEKKEIKNWNSSILDIFNHRKKLLKESWAPVDRYKIKSLNYYKKSSLLNEQITKSFENNLKFFSSEKNLLKKEEDYEEEDNNEKEMKKIMEEKKNKIYMNKIKEKLEEKIKSKKDKEKRERQKLKEEREMVERINTENNMSNMIKNMESILNKGKSVCIKGEQLINKTNKLMREVSPIERKRIIKMDIKINKEINKENKNDVIRNLKNIGKIPHVEMNVSKYIKLAKENEEENENEKKEKKNEIEEKEEENLEKKKEIEKEIMNAEKSSYSRLTENDYGIHLVNESLNMHKNNINDRIKIFKTRLMNLKNSEKKYKNLPLIPSLQDIYNEEESHILIISNNKNNNINIFDKESFYEEMNKLNYENFLKESNKRKIKKDKKKKLIKPILNKILEITDFISNYQKNNRSQLIDNSQWDELMDKFKNWEDIIDHKAEEKTIFEAEESKYLFDYGNKINKKDILILYDYMNYLNIFNDLIIPTSLRGKKYNYFELYEDIYNSEKHDVDIKEYEPKEDEIDNLILPKTPYCVNYKLFDIIENGFKFKYNQQQNNNILTMLNTNDITKRGKYFYLPIKMSLVGYPLSGKKVQSKLINSKYPNIKILDPLEIFENKLEEYKELKEPAEKKTKNKNMKPNQLEQLNKEREEKLEQFKPILDIIKPYLDKMEKNNNENNAISNDINDMEDILNDIYINLLIYELDKLYPDDKDFKKKLLEEINDKYKQYISLKEQIKEIKKNEEESKKEIEDKGSKNKKQIHNFAKDLEALNKQLESIIPSLYVGFIFINFPKNVKQAKLLENKITGYVSEFEKPRDIVEEKLFFYDNILDMNLKPQTTGTFQLSMFDLFINLNITSEEVNRRFKISKYDPTTKKVYNMEDNPPTDKKIIEKLLPGVPNFDEKKLKDEKELYENNEHNLISFYKIMRNGMKKIFNNVEQMNNIYNQKINDNIENLMEEIIFENYCKNIRTIIKYINKEEEKKETINKNKDDNSTKNEENKIKDLNIKEMKKNLNSSINQNTYKFSEDICNQFEHFGINYKRGLINFIHFISRQKEHVKTYLAEIQDKFVLYLNRKTDKVNLCQMYIDKYNSMLNNFPNLLENQTIYNDLSGDIEDVSKSIWIKIQSKKNEDIKYLQNIKDNGKLDNELETIWEFVIYIFEKEVQKYLVTCEIIIKYYLNQTGILPSILGVSDSISKNNNQNKYLLKINHLKFLFKGLDIPDNCNYNIEAVSENSSDSSKSSDSSNESRSDITEKKTSTEKESEKKSEKDKNNNNENKNEKEKNKTKTLEEKLEILFTNCLKIIIRQDILMKQYKERIKNFSPNTEKEIKSYRRGSVAGTLNSSISSRSSRRKSQVYKVSKMGTLFYEEELTNQMKAEKQKFKYRLMFLKYFILKYYNLIIECFNTTFDAMDDWIIMSVRSQNNSLNEVVAYLKKTLSKSNQEASLEDFEFDNYDNYKSYKVDTSIIFDKLNFNSIVNLKNKDNTEIVLINENDMSYVDKFIYNIMDLMQIYNYLKSFGSEGCEYLIKYEIVKEILIHQNFSKKKYGDLSNINNPNAKKNSNVDSDINSEINSDINNNNNITDNNIINFINLFNNRDSNNLKPSEDNNGIPKIMLFLSNINYITFLNKFSEYDNKYININELFTSLIIIGCELITSEKFIELIKGQLPKEKKISNHIILTKEEFLKINFWFENDLHLNSYVDEKEEILLKEDYKNKKNKDEKMVKIKKIKNCIFELNSEEEKIDLYKIIKLLDKFNGIKEDEKIYNYGNEGENDKKAENEEEKETKKEEKEENEKEKNENESEEVSKEEESEEESNESKSDESNKEEEETSKQNDSEQKSKKKDEKKNKKIKKNVEEIKNNIFNSLFFY